jgi:hypothetical protein
MAIVDLEKKLYSDTLNVLSVLSTFAAGICLATQFATSCSDAALQGLLSAASELFLASLFALLLVFLLLYGFRDDDPINGRRHGWVVCHLSVVGCTMMAAFMFLGGAIIAAGNLLIGILGLVLLFILAVAAISLGISIYWRGANDYQQIPPPRQPLVRPDHQVPTDIGDLQVACLMVSFVLEIVLVVALVALGIWQAIDSDVSQDIKNNCKPTTAPIWPSTTLAVSEVNQETFSWPTSTIPISVVNQETDTLLSITDIDTLLTLTLTDPGSIAPTSSPGSSSFTPLPPTTLTSSNSMTIPLTSTPIFSSSSSGPGLTTPPTTMPTSTTSMPAPFVGGAGINTRFVARWILLMLGALLL